MTITCKLSLCLLCHCMTPVENPYNVLQPRTCQQLFWLRLMKVVWYSGFSFVRRKKKHYWYFSRRNLSYSVICNLCVGCPFKFLKFMKRNKSLLVPGFPGFCFYSVTLIAIKCIDRQSMTCITEALGAPGSAWSARLVHAAGGQGKARSLTNEDDMTR